MPSTKVEDIAFPDPAEHGVDLQHIRVVDLQTLIELKLASGMTARNRLQDLADVQRLIETHGLKADYAERLHPYVKTKFLELCDVDAQSG